MSIPKPTKDYCPNCQQLTNHECLFYKSLYSEHHDDLHWANHFEIIRCLGCESIQFRNRYSDESMVAQNEDGEEFEYDEIKYYPKALPNHSLLKNIYFLPTKVRIVYNETIEALKNNCYVLASAGLRAIIEATCLDQNISGKTLEIKINNLVRNKLITEKDANRLHSIRFLGNDSIHEIDVPNEEKLRIALDIVEYLIKSLYLIDIDVNRHLDTVISQYDDFKYLIRRKIKAAKLNHGEEKSVREILTKDYRRIEQSYLSNFIQQLVAEINAGTISFLTIGRMVNGNQYFIIV